MELELIISGFTSALQPQNLLFIMIGLIFGIYWLAARHDRYHGRGRHGPIFLLSGA